MAVKREQFILDPGIGSAKLLGKILQLLKILQLSKILILPLAIGVIAKKSSWIV